MKTIGVEVSVKVGIKDFHKLSKERQEEELNCFQNELSKLISNTSKMTFLGGTGGFIKGVETDDKCFIKVV